MIEEASNYGRSGDTAGNYYVPDDLLQAIEELDRMLPPEAREELLQSQADAHQSGLGLWVRNHWGLWGKSCQEAADLPDLQRTAGRYRPAPSSHGKALRRYFLARGVRHPDDMSAAILDAWFAHLQGEPLIETPQLEGESLAHALRPEVLSDYWSEFINHLEACGNRFAKLRSPNQTDNRKRWMDFRSGGSSVRLAAALPSSSGLVRVLAIALRRPRLSATMLTEFDARAVEQELGARLEWRLEQHTSSEILRVDSAADFTDHTDWPRQHSWLASTMTILDTRVIPAVMPSAAESQRQRQTP